MLLTHGNIRKSAYLKYILGDVEEGEQQFPSGGQYKLFEDLHDASVKIITESEDVVLVLNLCTSPNTNKRIVFRKAKIISKNRVKRSGHIARLNKMWFRMNMVMKNFIRIREMIILRLCSSIEED